MTPAEALAQIDAARAHRVAPGTNWREANADAFDAEAEAWRALTVPATTDPDVATLLMKAAASAELRARGLAAHWRELTATAKARSAS